jgi:hypothetical protein
MSLDLLRADAKSACMQNVYRTGPAGGSFTEKGDLVAGGRCVVSASAAGKQKGFYDLTATTTAGISNDYFFPWLQRGVGWVAVPKAVPDGSIVMTGGVNGCTIIVTEQGTNYNFYHDGDSSSIKPGQVVGTEVARVAPKDYDPFGFAARTFQNALADAAKAGVKPVGDVSYGHFVVTVKQGGRFGMFVTGVISLNGLSKIPNGWGTSLIVTFG